MIHLRVEIPFRVEIFSLESKIRLGISARKKQAENFSLFFELKFWVENFSSENSAWNSELKFWAEILSWNFRVKIIVLHSDDLFAGRFHKHFCKVLFKIYSNLFKKVSEAFCCRFRTRRHDVRLSVLLKSEYFDLHNFGEKRLGGLKPCKKWRHSFVM